MPNRIVKESIWSSENLAKASLLAQGFFLRLLPLPDDHGCFDARTAILRARLFPLNYSDVTEKQIEKWIQELIAVDCIRVWLDSGIRYGYVPTWSKHQQVRSLHHRKTPVPPEELVTKTHTENKDDSNCKQVIAAESLNPNPNPIQTCVRQGGFDRFWEAYPKKVGKQAAHKAWSKLAPSVELEETILSAIGRQKRHSQWLNENGRYIPHAATWLNGSRWEDELKTQLFNPDIVV